MDARPARMIGKRVEKLIEDHQTETRTESQQIQTSMVEHNLKPVQITNYFFSQVKCQTIDLNFKTCQYSSR